MTCSRKDWDEDVKCVGNINLSGEHDKDKKTKKQVMSRNSFEDTTKTSVSFDAKKCVPQ